MADTPVTSPVAALLSLAAHELRTPAAVAAGYLRMARQDGESPLSDRQRRLVGEAERALERLTALVAEMSELAALDAHTAAVHREAFDLFAVVQSVARDVGQSADGRVRLEARGCPDGAPMTGDLMRLRAAVAALLRAALREQAEEGTLVVECRRTEDADGAPAAVVVVARDGAVQAAWTAARQALDERRGGLGLALPIARRVIEGHGGAVWSPAVNPGVDAEAHVRLRGAMLVSLPLAPEP